MEKKTLLAVVLSAAVFIIYYGFFYHPPRPQTPSTNLSSSAVIPESVPTPESLLNQAAGIPPTALPTPVAKTNIPQVLTEMENTLVRAELNSSTGLPQHWWLKKYFTKADKKGSNIDLLLNENVLSSPLGILLFPGTPPVYPQFELSKKTDQSLNYRAQFGNLLLTQSLDFAAKDYTLEMKLTVENLGTAPQTLTPGLRLSNQQTAPSGKGFLFLKEAPNFKTPFYMLGNKVRRHSNVEKLGILSEETGDISWAGLEDRYFLRIIVARNVSPQNKVTYGVKGQEIFTDLQYGSDVLAAGQKKDYAFTLYLGPKEPSLLKGFGAAHLEKAINYGWFEVVALPILYLLKLFESFLHNWGLAIIALTILIKILLNPLTKKSMQSMKAMQAIQPQLQKVREKYKDDRERLNLETMSLFKANKVNPMGGCLPMVFQMPIYIALYKVLYNATDLYHAPFFWFYHDLSAPDPYFALPILLGIFMVLQQKMTPSPSADPAQAKMMMIMPVMFSAFMLFLPVGLVLYIFVNTVMTVVQQYMHQKDLSLVGLLRGRKP